MEKYALPDEAAAAIDEEALLDLLLQGGGSPDVQAGGSAGAAVPVADMDVRNLGNSRVGSRTLLQYTGCVATRTANHECVMTLDCTGKAHMNATPAGQCLNTNLLVCMCADPLHTWEQHDMYALNDQHSQCTSMRAMLWLYIQLQTTLLISSCMLNTMVAL